MLLCRQVGYAEVCLSSLDASSADALALSQRLAARQPGTDTWRGFSVSSPFLPGAAIQRYALPYINFSSYVV
jgi:hypothetical protein